MAKRGGRSGRKYVRDSIGRFATTGATARGGRLKTKSGKKRATQTVKAKTGSKPAGAIKGKIKRDPGAAKPAVAATAKPAVAATAKPAVAATAKPAVAKRRGAVGKISEAKAGRIVARMDAQRGRKAMPGRRNENFSRTYERSRQFILKPAATARNKGKPISVNESVQKAVANAAKRRKPKPAAAKPAAAKVTRTGGRINAGRKADRKATLSVNKARSEERAARFDAMNKNKMAPFSSPKRQKQNQRLNDAVYEVNSRVQTRRNIRAQFPVNRKTPSLKAGKISSTIKKASATKAQKGRATANKERSLDSRGNIRGGKNRKTYRTSMKAAEFYSNPAKALKGIKKEVGYKAPRSLRKGVKQTPAKRPTVNSAKRAPDNARTKANRLKTTQAKVKYLRVEPDSSAFKSAVKQRDAALKARPAGTAGKVTFRSKARAASRFQQRANDVTGRVRMDIKYDKTKSLRATGGGGGKGARVRDTGASQTSLFGKPAPLRRASKVSVIKRRTGKRRFS